MCSAETLVPLVNAAVLLCHRLCRRLGGSHDFYVDLLKCAYSLALFALAQLHTQLPNDDTFNKAETVKKTISKLQGILKDWVSRTDVIGGLLFGASVKYRSSWKPEAEIKV